MLARLLMMPSEAYLGELSEPADVEAIHRARQFVRLSIAKALKTELLGCYQANLSAAPYRPEADEIARRSLKNACLAYLMLLAEAEILTLCESQFRDSNNMTDTSAALTALVHSEFGEAKNNALADFYSQWQHDPLVVDQWFAVQASDPSADAFERVQALMQHAAFDISNPNKVRSLIGVFCNQNRVNFHRGDGAGYAFLADQVMTLDKMNPQIAARLLTPLTHPLVVDQWFAVQASDPSADAFERVQALMQHAAFDISNPNKVRSLIGVFCNQNRVNFHRGDGAGYAFLADQVMTLDKMNPQIAARLLTPLTCWRKLTPERGELMQQQLQRIKAQPELSKDVLEVVTKSL